jgi:hypothetical protein
MFLFPLNRDDEQSIKSKQNESIQSNNNNIVTETKDDN